MSIVVIETCNSYNEELVYQKVKAAINNLGGIDKFIKKEEKILIKPNFLYPADEEKCVTTNPSVIKAMVKILEENGYKNLYVGDSPAFGTCKEAFKKLGLDEKYYTPMDKEVEKNGLFFTYEAVNSDAIIGLSKMKTHMLERITGAVKNMYGLICGKRKATGHVNFPNAVSFAKQMSIIHKSTNQRLHIMDGIIAMEGNGPSSGTPVKMGLILASSDPVSLDSVFCHLVNLDPTLVPTETVCALDGLGTYKEEEIELILDGEKISMDELVSKYGKMDFDVQREKDKLNILSIWSHISTKFAKKPVIDKKKCIKCGVCVNHCPVEGRAITFKNGKDKPPVYDYKKCIRCYCCQELCPNHAISKR